MIILTNQIAIRIWKPAWASLMVLWPSFRSGNFMEKFSNFLGRFSRKVQKFRNFKSKSNPTMRHLIGYVQKMLICHTKLSLFRTLQRVPRGITRFHWILYRLDIVELIYFVILMFLTSKMTNFNKNRRMADLTNEEKLVCHNFDKVWRHQLRLDCLCIYTIGDRLCVIIVQIVYLFIRVYSRSFLICSLIL